MTAAEERMRLEAEEEKAEVLDATRAAIKVAAIQQAEEIDSMVAQLAEVTAERRRQADEIALLRQERSELELKLGHHFLGVTAAHQAPGGAASAAPSCSSRVSSHVSSGASSTPYTDISIDREDQASAQRAGSGVLGARAAPSAAPSAPPPQPRDASRRSPCSSFSAPPRPPLRARGAGRRSMPCSSPMSTARARASL